MKKISTTFSMLLTSSVAVTTLHSCHSPENCTSRADSTSAQVKIDEFADLEILRYEVPGFDQLNLQQKKLAYYLYQAALSGRDIIYDQRGKNNV